jgi:hypothetical protein
MMAMVKQLARFLSIRIHGERSFASIVNTHSHRT